MSRVLGIIFGVLIVLLGIWCIMTPVETYGVISWLIAFALIAEGISSIMVWNDYRKIGVSDTFMLIGGIISIILGIVLLGSLALRYAVDVFIAYVVAWWLLITGVIRIVRSFKMRNARNTIEAQVGTNWGLALVLGVLQVLLGIFCVANPVIVAVALGLEIGIGLIAGGIFLIMATA